MRRALLLLIVGLAAALPGLSTADVSEVLKISAIPDENPSELLRIYTPFAEYLSKELRIKVQFTPVVDYAATVEGLAANKLDLVWYGGFTSVQAVRRTNGTAKRLVLRQEDAEFKSVFIAKPGSGIQSLKDLKGKTFAFGSVSSTSGHLMPRYFLLQATTTPKRTCTRSPTREPTTPPPSGSSPVRSTLGRSTSSSGTSWCRPRRSILAR